MEEFEIDAYNKLLKMVKSEVGYHYDSLLNDLVGEIGEMSNLEHFQLVSVHKNSVDKYHLLEVSGGVATLTEKGKIAEKIGMKLYLVGKTTLGAAKTIIDVIK